VLIGAGAAYLNPAWRIADAIAALVVALFILRVSVSLIHAAFREMVDTAPDTDKMTEIRRLAERVKGVRKLGDVRARYSGAEIFVELHIAVNPNISVRRGHDIAEQVEMSLIEQIDEVTRVTVHVEPDE
jgi:cation diffusion facilitator family transporter